MEVARSDNRSFELARHMLDKNDAIWPMQRIVRGGKTLDVPAPSGGYRLGDHDLPIAQHRMAIDELLDDLSSHEVDVAFAVGETGSGKTTNLPLAALESGKFKMIYVAEPRILLTRETRSRLVDRLSLALQEDASDLVGYATSSEAELHPDNKIIVGTHGYITGLISHKGARSLEDSLLIADEYHDREMEGDTVVEVGKSNGVPVIITSATINAEELAMHHCRNDGTPAPILEIEGRTHPIREISMDNSTNAALWSIKKGYDALYVLPRKADVDREMSRIAAQSKHRHVLLPLYSELPVEEQRKAFKEYDVPRVVVATEIACTGITLKVDTVIVTGTGRINSLKKGVTTLGLRHIPESRMRQLIGRAGRDRPGIAIHAPYDKTPKDLPPNPDKYDDPEITRARVDGLMVRLGTAGMRMGDIEMGDTVSRRLDYKDLPNEKEADYAKLRLKRLGAMATDLTFTGIGYEMASIPVDAQYGRMIVESRGYSADVQQFMIAAACVAQFNGVTSSSGDGAWKELSGEKRADLLRDLDVYLAAKRMDPGKFKYYSIIPQRIDKIDDHIDEILRRRGLEDADGLGRWPSDVEREQLLRCMTAGIEELFIRKNSSGKYHDWRDGRINRQLMSESAIRANKLIAGTPWNLESVSESNRIVRKYFVRSAMEVDLDRLLEVSPERCQLVENDYELDDQGQIMAHHEIFFDDKTTGYHVLRPIDQITEGLRKFVVNGMFQKELRHEDKLPDSALKFRKEIKELFELEDRSGSHLGIDDLMREVRDELHSSLPAEISTIEEMFNCLDYNHIRGFLGNKERQRIIAESPVKLEVKGQDGKMIRLDVTYQNHEAQISVDDHGMLRNLPAYIPRLDGRKLFVKIGASAKREEFYETKERYSVVRSSRRKKSS